MKTPIMINDHEIAGRMPLYKPEHRQANRDRIKTITRRVAGLQRVPKGYELVHETKSLGYPASEGFHWAGFNDPEKEYDPIYFKSRYKVGDIRVMCEPLKCGGDGRAWYSDTNEPVLVNGTIQWRWKRNLLTSVHMPYEAARSLFRIIGLRAERLQEIRNDVILNEGVRIPSKNGEPLLDISSKYAACNYINERTKAAFRTGRGYDAIGQDLLTAYFASLWDSINAKPKRTHRNPYTGNPEECYVSYPWKDIREIRKRSGLKWYVIGNPYNWVIEYEALK